MPFQFQPYSNPQADATIGALLRAQGQTRAQAVLQSAHARAQAIQAGGQAWGQAIGSIGDMLGRVPQQMQQAKALEQQTADRQLDRENVQQQMTQRQDQMDRAGAQAADAASLKQKNETALKIAQGLRDPDPQAREVVLKQIQDPTVQATARQLLKARDDQNDAYRKDRAQIAQKMGYDPEIVRVLVAMDPLPNALDHFNQMTNGGQDAAMVKRYVDSIATLGEKVPGDYTLNQGDVRNSGITNQPVAANPKPAPAPPTPPNPTEASLAMLAAKGDATAQKALDLMRPRPDGKPSEKAQASDALADTVIRNPSLWDDLTPTVKGEIAARLDAKGYSGFGKPLAPAAVKQISDSQTAIDSLKDLRSVLAENEQYIGPVAGLQALNPYSDARQVQAKMDLVRQRVGKALEGGVLRKEDEEKYKKILATLTDTPDTAVFKIDNLIKSVQQDVQNFVNQQRLSGRRVSEAQSDSVGGPTEGATKPIPNLPGGEQTFRSGKWIRTK